MKHLNLLVAFLITSLVLPAQQSLVGYVKEQSSGKTPLANVEVYALGAQTTYTNARGYFELQFASKKVGDLVAAVEFSLDGYVLINEEKCEGLTLAKDPSLAPLQIVMSKKGAFREQKAKYYGIIIDNATSAYEQQNQQLQAQLTQLETKLAGLQGESEQRATFAEERRILLQQIDNLQQEKKQAIANAERYAQIFAQIDTDGASELTTRALTLFEEGQIKAAIALLDDDQLRQNMQNAQAAKKEATTLRAQADSMLQQCVENYMVKARLCAADLQFTAAYRNYVYAVEGDSTQVDNLWELAYFCGELNQQKRAITFYRQALRHSQQESTQAHLLNNLGNELKNSNQYQPSELAYLEALEIYRRLAQSNPERYEPDVATTQNNLGVMYRNLNAYAKSELAYLEALEIRKRLAQSNPERYEPDVASTQNNLGIMYSNLNAYAKSELAYLEALEIRKRLAQSNPERYEPDVATTQNNLGAMYYNLNAYAKSELAYLEALEIKKRLAQSNPERYEPDVATTQNNLGVMYRNLNAYAKSELAYLEALEIRKRLAQSNPERYEPDVAMTQNNLGVMYADLNAYPKSELAYLEALEIRKRLAQSNPERYEPDVAMTQHNLGLLYADLNAYAKSELAYLEALEIRKRLAQSNPERYEPDVAMTQNNLGNMYRDLNAYAKSELAYLEALEIRKRLGQSNPERYEPDVASTQNNLGNMYADLNAYAKSELAYLEALEIYRRLAQSNPERFEPDVAMTQHNLGLMYFSLNQFDQASTQLAASLPIYQQLAAKAPRRYELKVARTLIIKSLILIKQGEQAAANESLLATKTIAEKYPEAPFSATVLQYFEKYYREVNVPHQEALASVQAWQQQIATLPSEAEKSPLQQKIVAAFNEAATSHPNNQAITTELSNAYGSLAWYQLFAQDFVAAEQAARQGLAADHSQEWINTNLALALLFQGKYAEAEAIYLQFKDQPYNGATYTTTFLQDLAALEAAGVTHADVERVRALLAD